MEYFKVWSDKHVKPGFVTANFISKQYVTIQRECLKLHSYIIMTNSEYLSLWIMMEVSLRRFEKQVKGIAFSPPAPYSRQPKVIYFLYGCWLETPVFRFLRFPNQLVDQKTNSVLEELRLDRYSPGAARNSSIKHWSQLCHSHLCCYTPASPH